jgi:putative flavoprotein involved in K+ transport
MQTIIIGGGQAGLSTAYHLARRNLSFRILDANARIGDAWRNRWDSLRLFTPVRYSGLDGSRFPGRADAFPTKDEMADYLEAYAEQFALAVESGVSVDHLSRQGDRFVLTAGDRRFEADQVVVAMANYQTPRIPAFAKGLDPRILQVHSSDYRSPAQLNEGGVLVAGVGNSGAEIAVEVARTHPTWLSGKETGHIPFRIESAIARHVLVRMVRFLGHHVLTLSTPAGRRMRAKIVSKGGPLIRVKPSDIAAAGIERVARVVGVHNKRPLLSDGRVLKVTNVIWCTGYQRGFSWIDLPIFGKDGEPIHERGVVESVPGLYFVGLHFLYAMSSATVVGVGRDAARVAKAIAKRTRRGRASEIRDAGT